jgi:putative aldouronate transport system substrate-binding protein
MAFRFDVEPIKNEMAAINALKDEYLPMLELGMSADIGKTVAEWRQKAEAAGLNAIHSELERQYNAWKSML